MWRVCRVGETHCPKSNGLCPMVASQLPPRRKQSFTATSHSLSWSWSASTMTKWSRVRLPIALALWVSRWSCVWGICRAGLTFKWWSPLPRSCKSSIISRSRPGRGQCSRAALPTQIQRLRSPGSRTDSKWGPQTQSEMVGPCLVLVLISILIREIAFDYENWKIENMISLWLNLVKLISENCFRIKY